MSTFHALAPSLACSRPLGQRLGPRPRFAPGQRTIRFILPNATGSGVDTITRAAQPALAKALGHPIVVENQPGAGGIVGLQALVKSAPDGITLSSCRTTS